MERWSGVVIQHLPISANTSPGHVVTTNVLPSRPSTLWPQSGGANHMSDFSGIFNGWKIGKADSSLTRVGRQGLKRSTRPSQTNNPGLGGDVRNWEQLMAHSPKYFLPISSRWRSRRPLWGQKFQRLQSATKYCFSLPLNIIFNCLLLKKSTKYSTLTQWTVVVWSFIGQRIVDIWPAASSPTGIWLYNPSKSSNLFWNNVQCIWSKLIQLKGLQLQHKSLNCRCALKY